MVIVGYYNAYGGYKRPFRVSGNEIIITDNINKLSSDLKETIDIGGMTIVFPVGLKKINEDLFLHQKIKGVKFPDSLQVIDSSAFEDCSLLEMVIFPPKLTEIGNFSFRYCSKLNYIKFNDNLAKIGNRAFESCRDLNIINIPSRVIKIGDGAFTCCSNLVEVNLSDNLEYLSSKLFWGCESLKKVKIPKASHTIQSKAFYGCVSLEGIEFDEKLGKLNLIEDSAFENCSTLTIINIPSTVETMGERVFKGCTGLMSVSLSDKLTYLSDEVFENCISLGDIAVSSEIRIIGNGAFRGCSSLKSVSLSDKLEKIKYETFKDCTSLEMVDTRNVFSIEHKAFMNCERLENVIFSDNLQYIGHGAFYGCKSLKSVVIPEKVYRIGMTDWDSEEVFGSFEGCISLESVIINSKIETLEKDTFKDCINLKDVKLPDTLTSIQGYAFENCSSLESIDLPKSLKWIGMGAFKGCTGLKRITFPDNLLSIAIESFYGATSLTKIDIPSSVKSIEKNAFKGCTSLSIIILQEGLEKIGEGAFSDLPALTSITIPSSVKGIGKKAFKGCTSLSTIILPEGLERIEEGIFSDLPALTSITIPSSVKSIEKNAFKGCSSLSTIILPEGLERIEEGAFSDLPALTNIVLPSGVINISNGVFKGCANLKNIVLSEQLVVINDSLFEGCNALTKVNLSSSLEAIRSRAFKDCRCLKNIQFSDKLVKIEDEAFCNCKTLTKVFIPEDVSLIGTSAFNGCLNLRKVRLSKNIVQYGSDVFKDCPLDDLTIYSSSKNITEILERIFNDTSKEYVNYIDKFRLNVICTNYKELASFLDSAYNLLCNSYYNKNLKLKINFIGVKLNTWQEFRFKSKYPEIVSIVKFMPLEIFELEEKEAWKEEEFSISPKLEQYREDVTKYFREIDNSIKDLPEELKNIFYARRDSLIDEYEKAIVVPDIDFSDNNETVELGKRTNDSYARDMLLGLENLVTQSKLDAVKQVVNIINCIELFGSVIDRHPESSDNIDDIIKLIIYFTNNFNTEKKDEFINSSKNILVKYKDKYLECVKQGLSDDSLISSGDEWLWSIELEGALRGVFTSVLSYKQVAGPYLELLDALELKEVKSCGGGDSISKLIINVKYCILSISDNDERGLLENQINNFCSKYIERINLILRDFDNIKEDDFENLENEMREEIHPLLEKLDFKVQKEYNTKDILDELSNCIVVLNEDNIVPLPDDFSIYGIIGELHNKLVFNDYLPEDKKNVIKLRLLSVVQGWINKISDSKEDIWTDLYKKVQSDILKNSMIIDNYLVILAEGAKYFSVIEGVKDVPNSKK